MEHPNLEQIERVDESNLSGLDGVVLTGLELFMQRGVPWLDLGRCKSPLVVDSGTAAAMGKTLLR